MKAQDLTLNELVEFKEGAIYLHGSRLVLHSMNSFGQFRKDLIDMVGVEQARRTLIAAPERELRHLGGCL